MGSRTKSRRDVYQEVTDAILERLAKGTVPWRQPWVSLRAMSASTGKPYRGLNALLLAIAHEKGDYTSAYWATYRKINELGGQVRRGERGSLITFWKTLKVADKETEEERTIPFLRAYTVFNVEQADWPEGIPAKFTTRQESVDPIAEAEQVATTYLSGGPTFAHGGERAYYRPPTDHVQMPPRDTFASSEAYYSVLFHELGHSTGHSSRLDRETVTEAAPFGSPVYSREELVAELTAAMVNSTVGIETPKLLDQSASYIDGWRRKLAEDGKAVVWAAGRAQKAADLILGTGGEEEGNGGASREPIENRRR